MIVPCPACQGSGTLPGNPLIEAVLKHGIGCTACNGSGEREVYGDLLSLPQCKVCKGSGSVSRYPLGIEVCSNCQGMGRVHRPLFHAPTASPGGVKSPKVFISYSQDSPDHMRRVLEIAQQLRADGLDCEIDQFVDGSPAEGWPRWMLRRVQDAEKILLVCSETYKRRFLGEEKPESGKGADWEGMLVIQELYDEKSINKKFIPILLTGGIEDHIPLPLRPYTHYRLPDKYDDLYRVLTHQPVIIPQPIGKRQIRPPASSGNVDTTAAELRSPEIQILERACTKSRQIAGQSEALLHELISAAGLDYSPVSITLDELKHVCAKIDPNGNARTIVGGNSTQGWIFGTWLSYMGDLIDRSRKFKKEADEFKSYLQAEHVLRLASVDQCFYFSQMDIVRRTRPKNSDISWLCDDIWKYVVAARELKRYADQQLAKLAT